MKKIYLDWNVINHLEENAELHRFILQNLSHFVFVYSPAHFSDLMRSYNEGENNAYFEKDLERLEAVCETHLMRYYDKKLNIHRCSPREFLEKEGKNYPFFKDFLNPNFYKEFMKIDGLDFYGFFSESLKSISFGKTIELPLFGGFSNAFELFGRSLEFIEKIMTDKEFVKAIRTGATKDVEDKEITCISDYNPTEVMGVINAFFKRYGADFDLEELINKVIIDEQKGNKMLLFESIYAGLDLMRYHSDKRNFANILADSDHAFYGSFCDVLVTDDTRMRYKTEAVYSYFGFNTKIISKHELMDYLINELANENNLEAPIKELFSDQHIPQEYEEGSVYIKWVRLDCPYYSFFNKLEYRLPLSSRQSYFVFTRELGFEKYVYYTEIDKLFEIIKCELHDFDAIQAFEEQYVEKYYANDKTAEYALYFSQIILVLGVLENQGHLMPIMYMLMEEQAE